MCDAVIIGAVKSVAKVGLGIGEAVYSITKPIVTGVTRLGWDVGRFTASVVGMAITVPLRIGGKLLGVRSSREKLLLSQMQKKLMQARLNAAKSRSGYIQRRG